MNCLVLDQGNTSTKWGLFHNNVIVESGRISDEELGSALTELRAKHSVPFYYSSVRSDSEQQNFLALFNFCKPIEGKKFPTYNYSEGVAGKDRLANVAGAIALFGKIESLIVDFGTCITYSVGKNNELVGGVISLGAQSRLRGMHEFTGRLPLLELAETNKPFENSTNGAMLSSVNFGILSELKGYIELAIAEMPGITVVFTGTDSEYFAKHLNYRIFVELNLTLIGLYAISCANES
jgi:type III pantothenate kinase